MLGSYCLYSLANAGLPVESLSVTTVGRIISNEEHLYTQAFPFKKNNIRTA